MTHPLEDIAYAHPQHHEEESLSPLTVALTLAMIMKYCNEDVIRRLMGVNRFVMAEAIRALKQRAAERNTDVCFRQTLAGAMVSYNVLLQNPKALQKVRTIKVHEMVKTLGSQLARSGDIDLITRYFTYEELGAHLVYVCRGGNVAALRYYMLAHPDLAQLKATIGDSLIDAAWNGHVRVFMWLRDELEFGSTWGRTIGLSAVERACSRGHTNMMRFLVDMFGFSLDDIKSELEEGIYGLISYSNGRNTLQWIRETFPSLSSLDFRRALRRACLYGNLEGVKAVHEIFGLSEQDVEDMLRCRPPEHRGRGFNFDNWWYNSYNSARLYLIITFNKKNHMPPLEKGPERWRLSQRRTLQNKQLVYNVFSLTPEFVSSGDWMVNWRGTANDITPEVQWFCDRLDESGIEYPWPIILQNTKHAARWGRLAAVQYLHARYAVLRRIGIMWDVFLIAIKSYPSHEGSSETTIPLLNWMLAEFDELSERFRLQKHKCIATMIAAFGKDGASNLDIFEWMYTTHKPTTQEIKRALGLFVDSWRRLPYDIRIWIENRYGVYATLPPCCIL